MLDEEEEEEEDEIEEIDDEESSSCFLTEARDAAIGRSSNATKHDRRVIVHIDLDCFYAQCEMRHNPSLRDRPMAIQQKYLLVTSNQVARNQGVHKMQSLAEARRRCPELVVVNGEDLTRYRECSELIYDVLKTFTPKLERLGLDETYLDITAIIDAALGKEGEGGGEEGGKGEGEEATEVREKTMAASPPPSSSPSSYTFPPPSSLSSLVGNLYTPGGGGGGREKGRERERQERQPACCTCGCVERLKAGSHVAQAMRQRLFEELGFTSCAGISNNKMLAKMAGELHKPNAQTTLLPGDAIPFLSPLPPRRLPGCGWATARSLQRLGIDTVACLREISLSTLAPAVGEMQ
ncbi:hypothetical protein VYU27_009625, partial [Nannochloropsis oceanica]